MNGIGGEFDGGGNALLLQECEGGGEGFECAGDTVAADTAQFEQIFGAGEGHQETPIVFENAAEFGRVHAGGDGECEGERAVGVGDEAICIGDDPFACGIAAGSGFDGGQGDVDAVGTETKFAGE